uniref:Uncharacterized protein n=1 Tax=Syphacia muris TaxID=451379 RepID=A0A0N5AJF3_9BILA
MLRRRKRTRKCESMSSSPLTSATLSTPDVAGAATADKAKKQHQSSPSMLKRFLVSASDIYTRSVSTIKPKKSSSSSAAAAAVPATKFPQSSAAQSVAVYSHQLSDYKAEQNAKRRMLSEKQIDDDADRAVCSIHGAHHRLPTYTYTAVIENCPPERCKYERNPNEVVGTSPKCESEQQQLYETTKLAEANESKVVKWIKDDHGWENWVKNQSIGILKLDKTERLILRIAVNWVNVARVTLRGNE